MSMLTPLSLVSHPIANFHPSHWSDNFSNFTSPSEATQQEMEEEAREIKEEVKIELFASATKPVLQLRFIDAFERLGVPYHFETEIEEALQQVYKAYQDYSNEDDLCHVSVLFRMLRQHGFHVSCDIFKKFKDDKGSFKGSLREEMKSILSLYEAAHVGGHEDDILEEALAFTTACMLEYVANKPDSLLADQVAHALHQPLHKGITRLESKHYISFYEEDPLHNEALLKFAKLDFNLLQLLHQNELRDLNCWWKGLHSKLPFTRDRSVEGYFWALGCYYEPRYSLARKIFTKMFMVQQILDDIYDAYGTFQELELFTQAINRWDYGCMELLPEHLKYSYHALLETFDETEQELAKEGRSFCIHYAKEQMKRNCRAWFHEAKWRHQNNVPTYDEYMEVALVSVGHVMGIVASYLGIEKIATKEAFEWVSQTPMPKLVKASDIILRLMNDIGGHKFEQTRNHVASSIQCYMKQHGILEEEQICETLENQVEQAWKDVNQAMLKPFAIPKPLLDRILNFARVPDVMYKGRTDGYTIVNNTIKEKVASVLFYHVPL